MGIKIKTRFNNRFKENRITIKKGQIKKVEETQSFDINSQISL